MFEHLNEDIKLKFLRSAGCESISEVGMDLENTPLFTLFFGEGEQETSPEKQFNFFIITILCNNEIGIEGGFWNGIGKRYTKINCFATWYDSYDEAEKEALTIGLDYKITGFNTKPF
jgi:hypothetical protein